MFMLMKMILLIRRIRWEWGVGSGEWGAGGDEGDEGDKGTRGIKSSLNTPNAPCPMPHAQYLFFEQQII